MFTPFTRPTWNRVYELMKYSFFFCLSFFHLPDCFFSFLREWAYLIPAWSAITVLTIYAIFISLNIYFSPGAQELRTLVGKFPIKRPSQDFQNFGEKMVRLNFLFCLSLSTFFRPQILMPMV